MKSEIPSLRFAWISNNSAEHSEPSARRPDTADAPQTLEKLFNRYTESMKKVPDSIAVTKKLLRNVQAELNVALSADIS
jgi:hypothetical protein